MAKSLPTVDHQQRKLAAVPRDERKCRICNNPSSKHCPDCSACPGGEHYEDCELQEAS